MSRMISRFFGAEAVAAELERNPTAEAGASHGIRCVRLFERPIGYEIVFSVDDRDYPDLSMHDSQNYFFYYKDKQFVYSLPPDIPHGETIPYTRYNKDEMSILLIRRDVLYPELAKK